LHTAVGGEKAAAAGVEGWVIFEDRDSGLNSVEGGASTGEDFETGLERGANSGFVGRGLRIRNCPGAAVNEQNRDVHGSGYHLLMVVHRGEFSGDAVYTWLPK
jgi:hypothetical protein